MIYGVGIDLVMISRIEEALQRWGERFREKVFTPGEIQYCGQKRNPAPSFAARFAAKEALAKALGVGIRRGVHWKDVEVKRGPLGNRCCSSTAGRRSFAGWKTSRGFT
jgi:holo-[acyl-carrier protein] synthase